MNIDAVLSEAPGVVVLAGVVGSQAYGLATSTSDVDVGGVFAAPTDRILSLSPPPKSLVRSDPDVSLHELGHFFRLAANANPSILERLFLDEYLVLTEVGVGVVAHRDWFLSKMVSRTYGGYAISQMRRLRSDLSLDRREKYSRHCFRLLAQGRQLLETGTLDVRVADPDRLFELGRLDGPEMLVQFEAEIAALNAVESSLPERPDIDRLSDLLVEFRHMF